MVHSLKPRASFLSPSKDSHDKDKENRNQSPIRETENDDGNKEVHQDPVTAGTSGVQQDDDDSITYSDDHNDYGDKAQSPSSIRNTNAINPLAINGEVAESQVGKIIARSYNLHEESPYARIRETPNIKQQADSDNSDEDLNMESNQYMQRRLSFMSTRARLVKNL